MERRKALAVASAATLMLGGGIVAAASMSGASFLGFGSDASTHGLGSFSAVNASASAAPRVVVRKRDVYDRYVVDTGNGAVDGGPASARATPSGGGAPGLPPTGVTEPATTPITTPQPTVPPANQPPSATTPTSPTTRPGEIDPPPTVPTTVPSTPTTLPTTPPTTRPPGVPHDWPAGKPIPPMPPNCRQPQLELNGVWNCQSDD